MKSSDIVTLLSQDPSLRYEVLKELNRKGFYNSWLCDRLHLLYTDVKFSITEHNILRIDLSDLPRGKELKSSKLRITPSMSVDDIIQKVDAILDGFYS